MKFTDFTSHINSIKKAKNPGLASQLKMAPEMRQQFDEAKILARNPRKAATLMLIYPKNGETYFLLTERASYNGTHSAQISFPGGKVDKDDANAQETALREVFEEVGVQPNTIEVLREMTTAYIPPSNFLVQPFVGLSTTTPTFTPNEEVQTIIEVKLAHLLDDTCLSEEILKTSYMDKIAVPCFKLNSYVVWGATAMILHEIKDILKQL